MERDFQAISIHELGAGAGFRRPVQVQPARVTMESPALEVMTDLARVSPAVIRPQAPVEGANHYMIARGVRLLLVVDDHEVVIGVLTATDILGEKSMRSSTELGKKRSELTVADLMVPAGQVEVLALSDVQSARVGHVVQTLRRAGRHHALVVEHEEMPPQNLIDPPTQATWVRGIFSVSQVARQLGVALQTSEIARTFAEIEAALGR